MHYSAKSFQKMNPKKRANFIDKLSDREAMAMLYDWDFWARDNQKPPKGDWSTWLLMAGRGFGKTRTGAEWVRDRVENGIARRIAIVGPTIDDAIDTMVEGVSGILAVSPPDNKPKWVRSTRTLTWKNGAQAKVFGAEKPSKLRGPQHDTVWGDEPAEWRYYESYTNIEFGLRIGSNPQMLLTGTPKPVKIIKDVITDKGAVVTGGSTYDNVDNLSSKFKNRIIDRYEGTRLGQQELHAKLLKDVPGALWNDKIISAKRLKCEFDSEEMPNLIRIVIAVDPPVTSGPDADECGIIVCGLDAKGRGYIIDDFSCQGLSPNGWAKKAIDAYYKYNADRMIAEVNNGGELVETIVRGLDTNISYRAVRASKGKVARAEPIAALYEQGRVCHVGTFPTLEEQQCEFTSDFDKAKMGYSPDRVDALVWGLTELMLDLQGAPRIRRL